MEIRISTVILKSGKIPQISLEGFWIEKAGFDASRLAKFQYSNGNINIILDSNESKEITSFPIKRIPSLVDGGLIKIHKYIRKGNYTTAIGFGGEWLKSIGFEVGQRLILKVSHGLINIKPVSLSDSELISVLTHKRNNRMCPKIRLSGDWLNTIGFSENTLVSVEYGIDGICLKPCGEGVGDYLIHAKKILKQRSGSMTEVKNLFNFKYKKYVLSLEITDFCLEEMGYKIGFPLLIKSEHGKINISLLNMENIDDAIKRAN